MISRKPITIDNLTEVLIFNGWDRLELENDFLVNNVYVKHNTNQSIGVQKSNMLLYFASYTKPIVEAMCSDLPLFVEKYICFYDGDIALFLQILELNNIHLLPLPY